VVCAADQLAARAGLALLDEGGSAADAAVAAGLAMAVVGPHFCGLGGDALMVVSAPGADPVALLGVGRAGSGADPAGLRAQGHAVMPLRDDLRSVPVPGALDGWLALHERFGRRPLERVLAPARTLAEEGFAATTLLHLAAHLVAGRPGTEDLCPGGRPPAVGQRVRLPALARTLGAVAERGRDGLYAGEAGRALLEAGRGLYAPEDLARSQAEWVTPLRLRAFGHDLFTVPPPSQGYLTLAGARVAELAGLPGDEGDPLWPHLVVEAARAVGHDRPAVLFDGADGQALVSGDRLAQALARIDPDRAAPPDVAAPGSPAPDGPRLGPGDTTHLCALDEDGLGVTLTQSNALDFGSHLVAGTSGVFLHNRGLGFSLEPGHPAELSPGRRPPHTLSPGLALRPDGSLALLFGTMGGDAQPQILVQVLARVLGRGLTPAAALDRPRLALDAPAAGPFRLWWGDDLTVRPERSAPSSWAPGLLERGHRVLEVAAYDPVSVGCAQAIAVDPDGAQWGGADPRGPEGAALTR
jgi:gamma-glutamyltranspeptidase/glutathione hydrolase